ncbi:50S ribosomal protein L10 [Candidatus Terasakiella magnetica]|uniref:Large ribosomal subunit protein uL10 n=1 Tax=Candidatus Terasakiella magnetica TaxID=1867952 RepID=A0A1C3RDJ2_9PROT|nr:50S ribosomal protein L10 [Candidatus Terasakiella magnetica]SCA55312.1 50S ribosomal protein L10 [Candidatus Terasakiella magnetica]
MNRTEKEELVAEMRDVFANSSTVVVAHYSGLTVSEMEELREQVREAGAGFKVTKNRLTKLALADSKFEGLGEMLSGPTAIAYSEDAVAAAKASVAFAKKNEKLVILGGAMDETALDVNGVKALASMPSLDELRGKLVGVLQAPAQKLAAVSQAPAGQLARVFGAYGKSEA